MTLPDTPGEVLTKTDQDGRSSPPICSNSAPGAKDPRRVHKVPEGKGRSGGGIWFRQERRTELRTANSLRRLLLVTVSGTREEILNLKHGYGHQSSLKGKQAIFKPCHADSNGDKGSERGESGDKRDKYHPGHHGQIKIIRARNSFFRVPRTSAASFWRKWFHSKVGGADLGPPCWGVAQQKDTHKMQSQTLETIWFLFSRGVTRATQGLGRWTRPWRTDILLMRWSYTIFAFLKMS